MNNKTASREKHEFALFIDSLASLIEHKNVGNVVLFSDESLVHRIVNVLRLGPDDQCVFFDRSIQASVIIVSFIGRKQIQVTIQSIKKTTVLTPHVTFLLPILKRDDYQAALYGLTEVGVNTIQPVFTRKTIQQSFGNKDSERAQRIIIGAAEQSKNFAYPELKEPMTLEKALTVYGLAQAKIFFHPAGQPFFAVMEQLYTSKPDNILLLVGPEGDLHSEEKRIVQENEFIFCTLTPTIMRAVQASALGAGFIRSLL